MATRKPKKTPPSERASVLNTICRLLCEGVPLRQILREQPGMPAVTTFYMRLDPKSKQYVPATAERIARARAEGFDAIADGCLEIADDARNDWMEKVSKEGDADGVAFNAEHVQRSKLRIETRLKLLAKWDPKRYGELQKVEHSGEVGITGLAGRMRAKRSEPDGDD
jgi:benzoyl-CoA reductase/2-hydroxyglutaryl-CoA dehydratase subunit BcrC/BadD/HgdB